VAIANKPVFVFWSIQAQNGDGNNIYIYYRRHRRRKTQLPPPPQKRLAFCLFNRFRYIR